MSEHKNNTDTDAAIGADAIFDPTARTGPADPAITRKDRASVRAAVTAAAQAKALEAAQAAAEKAAEAAAAAAIELKARMAIYTDERAHAHASRITTLTNDRIAVMGMRDANGYYPAIDLSDLGQVGTGDSYWVPILGLGSNGTFSGVNHQDIDLANSSLAVTIGSSRANQDLTSTSSETDTTRT